MKKLTIISTIILGMAVASCDSYLDINQDPNSPTEENMTPSIMLPAAEMGLAATYGNLLRIPGGYFSQHYAHMFGTSNYVDYSQFTMSPVRSSSAYSQLNRVALKNLQTIKNLAEKNEEWGTVLAATTLRCFTLQALVDCYGSVPYSEALDISNSSPHYDEGSVVYEGILKELDEALAKANANDVVATNFLYKGQNAANWIKFANALKLKILSRESGVASVDAQIAAIISEGNLPTEDVAYTSCWSNETGQMNPYFSEEFSTSFGSTQINVTANLALVGTMQLKDANGDVVYEDPRLAAFFDPNSSGEFTGGVSGTNFSTTDNYKSAYWCRPKMAYNSPVYLITVAETEFFIAEYFARKNDVASAAAHYAAAVQASFASAGVGGADEYIARNPYDQGAYKKVLGIAKWVALAGVNNFESWCELRRLRYPAFGTVTGAQLYNIDTDAYAPQLYQPGTLYTPIQVDGNIGNNHLIERWPFASSSSSSNGNAPKFENADYLKPIFWAQQ
ncbi:MAG: SusD/RagB family nutrient-binding outer membrane lipoprotein [Prevotella sp.]|nr:SusD/RagB family nutrient-binding outer membrane lipoprotein [Prevotella sp.]MBR6981807.1 SusD/RagB family nutrient-binding outer membrane lipoprotein [Prevotella sp.]